MDLAPTWMPMNLSFCKVQRAGIWRGCSSQSARHFSGLDLSFCNCIVSRWIFKWIVCVIQSAFHPLMCFPHIADWPLVWGTFEGSDVVILVYVLGVKHDKQFALGGTTSVFVVCATYHFHGMGQQYWTSRTNFNRHFIIFDGISNGHTKAKTIWLEPRQFFCSWKPLNLSLQAIWGRFLRILWNCLCIPWRSVSCASTHTSNVKFWQPGQTTIAFIVHVCGLNVRFSVFLFKCCTGGRNAGVGTLPCNNVDVQFHLFSTTLSAGDVCAPRLPPSCPCIVLMKDDWTLGCHGLKLVSDNFRNP